MHYLLFYEVTDDYLSRRAEFREAHLEKAWGASERGDLLLGGALADPVDGAVLLFRGDSREVAEKFAAADPYVTSGLVKRWHVREWTTVAGEASTTPVGPKVRPSDATAKAVSPASNRKIARFWKARSTIQASDKYVEHATQKVFPALDAIDGHRGAYLLRRAVNDAIEFVVLTLWDSMESVRNFAGATPEKAVVGAEARAVLTSFDETVTHYEVVARTGEAAE